jgi:peptidoglycan-associated lipoprotein
MKNFSKILGLLMAAVALFLSACAKKPMRATPEATQTGPSNNNGVNPEAVALPNDTAPGTNLAPRDPNILEDENTIRGLLQPVYFEFDRSAVGSKEREKVDAAVKYLKDNADKRLLMEGHCDWRGTAEYNLGLGDRRANAVKRYLETLGIDSKRLEILSKGSTDAKQGGTDADWAKDRRVDFVVLKK